MVELLPVKMSFIKLCGIIDLILHVKRSLVAPAEGAGRLEIDCCESLRLHKDLASL